MRLSLILPERGQDMALNIPFKIMSIYSTIWMRAKARVVVKGPRRAAAAAGAARNGYTYS